MHVQMISILNHSGHKNQMKKIELVDHFSLLKHVVYAEPKCDCMRMKTVMMKPIKQTFYHVSWKHCISCF